MKLLEGIGMISETDSKKASARGGNYQDAVTAPVSRDYDDSGIVEDGDGGLGDGEGITDPMVTSKAFGVEKVKPYCKQQIYCLIIFLT